MDKIKTTEGDLMVRDARFTIVASRFNDFIVDSLLKASLHCLRQHGVPVGFGILTVDTIEQAIERAGTKAGNKGEEATLAVIEMVNLLRRID